jgi:hypothetical protein
MFHGPETDREYPAKPLKKEKDFTFIKRLLGQYPSKEKAWIAADMLAEMQVRNQIIIFLTSGKRSLCRKGLKS